MNPCIVLVLRLEQHAIAIVAVLVVLILAVGFPRHGLVVNYRSSADNEGGYPEVFSRAKGTVSGGHQGWERLPLTEDPQSVSLRGWSGYPPGQVVGVEVALPVSGSTPRPLVARPNTEVL
jgi:hypothetical protein